MSTKKALRLSVAPLMALALSMGPSLSIQAAETGDRPNAKPANDGSELVIFAAQKFWATTWDVPLMDAQIVLPSLVGPPTPLVKTNYHVRRSETSTIPITTIGAMYGGWSLSSSYFANTDFDTRENPTNSVSRREWDLALGYAVLPTMSLSVAYRKGRISEGTTATTAALTGLRSGYDLIGWLVGVSANAPLSGRFSMYGNLAAGTVTDVVDVAIIPGKTEYKGSYRIGELGFSYRFLGAQDGSSFFKSLSAQIGYRAQIVTVRDMDFPVYDVATTAMVANEKVDVRSTADGVVFGVVAAF